LSSLPLLSRRKTMKRYATPKTREMTPVNTAVLWPFSISFCSACCCRIFFALRIWMDLSSSEDARARARAEREREIQEETRGQNSIKGPKRSSLRNRVTH